MLLLLVCGHAFAAVLPCPVTSSSGALTLNCINPRSGGAGISPLLAIFDCTGTTDTSLSANQSVMQDVNYIWNFNDRSPISGAGTWSLTLPGQSAPILTGSGSAYRYKNTATGIISSHLYQVDSNVTPGAADSAYTAIVQATDAAGNTATCGMSITVFDASGSNGFAGTKTTCVAATTTPVAGAAGCPTGANVLETASLTTATSTSNLGADHRVLLHCTDTFTGGTRALGANPTTPSSGTPVGTATPVWSLGAYGTCPGTQSGRPIISQSEIQIDWASVDGRIADLDLEGSGASPPVGTAFSVGGNFAVQATPALQTTLYNLLSNGYDESFQDSECTQCGLIQVVQTQMGANQGTFWNLAENNCTTNSALYNCGGTPSFTPNSYNVMLGDYFNGAGSTSASGPETVRTSGGSDWIIENSTFLNATTSTAVLKMHSGNTKNSDCVWIGYTSMYWYLSDDLFGGQSGGELVETIEQSGTKDERIQFVVAERNLFHPTGGGQLLAGSMNQTVRDNVFVGSGTTAGNRGFQGSSSNASSSSTSTCVGGVGTTGAPTIPLYPQFNEDLNNTCNGGGCVSFSTGNGTTAPANDSLLQNTMTFSSSGVSNSGSGNTVSNNSPNTTANPGFKNDSGTLSLITDFQPTANFAISCTPLPTCTAVPVQSDALGTPWLPTWNLGAVHH